jgi:hypothetical protein
MKDLANRPFLQPQANACILESRGASTERPARRQVLSHRVVLTAVFFLGIASVLDANGADLAAGSTTSPMMTVPRPAAFHRSRRARSGVGGPEALFRAFRLSSCRQPI